MSEQKRHKRIDRARFDELRELHTTRTRDIANRFLDDPFEADEVTHLALQRLRRLKASELPRDDKYPAKLANIVMCMCLQRLGQSSHLGEAPYWAQAR